MVPLKRLYLRGMLSIILFRLSRSDIHHVDLPNHVGEDALLKVRSSANPWRSIFNVHNLDFSVPFQLWKNSRGQDRTRYEQSFDAFKFVCVNGYDPLAKDYAFVQFDSEKVRC
jgi:hypothetical protein